MKLTNEEYAVLNQLRTQVPAFANMVTRLLEVDVTELIKEGDPEKIRILQGRTRTLGELLSEINRSGEVLNKIRTQQEHQRNK
ncbi:MAG: hypothetical protein C0602_00095 [Denitrovibrio sp.]|nr:MAG: hypothetical protein C0602_00095 [Denitrovibrio sp.]